MVEEEPEVLGREVLSTPPAAGRPVELEVKKSVMRGVKPSTELALPLVSAFPAPPLAPSELARAWVRAGAEGGFSFPVSENVDEPGGPGKLFRAVRLAGV